MISVTTLKSAVAAYIDAEVISHLQDWRKWVLGIGSGVYLARVDALIEQHRPMLTELGYLTEDGEVDIDKAYKDFRAQADKRGEIKMTLPLLGEVRAGVADIDKLYKYATGGGKDAARG